ncbi:MAG TPA: MFS transporter [Candidatus Acidoferrales bacterium]|nr:MFS transporter [Candidatus Acidoferrales bacterium]
MRIPSALTATFASLQRHRNYRLYFYGQLISQIGTWLQNAAQAWLVLDLTHSPQAVGVMGFALYGPYALLGLFGGALADRLDRKRTLIVTQSAMALAAAILALVVVLRVDRVWVVDLLAAMRGTVLVLNNPSRQALMVQIVGRRELANAIALNSSLNNATRIVGPAIAGVLIAAVGTAACFALNAISFVPVIVALAMMRRSEFHTRPRRIAQVRSFRAAIVEGLRYARRRKTIAVALTMLFVISLSAINFQVLLPIVARQTLHGGPEVYGLITACFGFGALIGALFTAARTKASPTVVLIAAAGFGAMQFAAAPQTNAFALGAVLVVMGVFYTTYTATTNALVQLATPEFLQGRVAGLYSYLFLASGPIGSLLVGWLSERGGTSATFTVAGIATLAITLAGVLTRPWPMPSGAASARRRRA